MVLIEAVTDNNLTPAVFKEALMMVSWRWGLRRDLVMTIFEAAGDDGWASISRRTIARRIGCSDRYVADLLGSVGRLWRVERVILREAGRGGRVTRLRVNPNLRSWREVPWIVADPDERDRRYAAAAYDEAMARWVAPFMFGNGAMGRAANGAVTAPFRGPAPEPMARWVAPNPPLIGAVAAPMPPPEWRDGPPPNGAMGRAKPAPNGAPSLLASSNSLEKERELAAETAQATAVIDAIYEATGKRLWGVPRGQLVALVDALDDPSWIVTELLRPGAVAGWQDAIQLVADLLARGRPTLGPLAPRRCPICGNATIDGADFCPEAPDCLASTR